jgi:hypothetical protein
MYLGHSTVSHRLGKELVLTPDRDVRQIPNRLNQPFASSGG